MRCAIITPSSSPHSSGLQHCASPKSFKGWDNATSDQLECQLECTDPARNDFWELAGGLPNARSRGRLGVGLLLSRASPARSVEPELIRPEARVRVARPGQKPEGDPRTHAIRHNRARLYRSTPLSIYDSS